MHNKFKSELSVVDVIVHLIIWILLIVCTLGLAAFVFPYYMYRFIISKTFVVDAEGRKVGRLSCTIDLASIIGNIFIWFLLSIVTLGLAYFVFLYKILAHCFNHTTIIDPAL